MRIPFVIAVSLAFSLGIPVAHAEIGLPTAPGGIYLSFEGGYHQSDAPGAAARGASTVVPAASVGTAYTNDKGTSLAPVPTHSTLMVDGSNFVFATTDGGSFISADHGGYGGATIGYTLASPLGIMSRVELYGTGSFANESDTAYGAFGIRGVDNRSWALFAAIPNDIVKADIDQSVRSKEIGLRFKSDQRAGPLAFALSMEPFYVRYEQETDADATLAFPANTIIAFANRRSDVSANLFGAQLALETVVPLGGPFSLIGRGSAGIYNVSADGDFSTTTDLFHTGLSDDRSRAGYRLGAEAGLRYIVNSSTWLSLIASVDYLSEVPTAVLPRFENDPDAHVGFDDVLDWRTGIRLTFASDR
jgi:hypothetical protein